MNYVEKLNLLYSLSRTLRNTAHHFANGDLVAYKAGLDQACADLAYIMANETVEPTKGYPLRAPVGVNDVRVKDVRTFEISIENVGVGVAEAFRGAVSRWMAENGDLAFLITSKAESEDTLEAQNIDLEGGE